MILQKVNTVVWLVLSSGLIFAGFSPRMLRWRMRFVIAGLSAMTRVNGILNEASWPLRRAVQERPHILGILVWPYVDSRWSFEEKVKAIHAHFDSLDGPRRLLDFPTDSSVVLTRFPEVNPELSLVLDKPMSAVREGQVTLNLFHGDQRIYTCAFTLGVENGERVAYVGAIQGVPDPSILELYKTLTKQFHGMRPRDLLIELMKACCVAMEVPRVLFVGDRYRHHRSSYFRQREDLHTSYDEVWKDRGAVERADGFFEAGAQPTRKAIEEISSAKRGQYRKRYALLDDVALRIQKPFREAAERVPRESKISSLQAHEPVEA